MGWKKTLSLVNNFEDAITRLSNRVETANNRGEQLAWKNYRKWYLKLVHETKKNLRALKRELSREQELNQVLETLDTSFRNIFDVESDTKVKWSDISYCKQTWQRFKEQLDRRIKAEYDLFPKRNFDRDEKLCFVLMPFDRSFNAVYTKAIKSAVRKTKMKPQRADEIFKATPIVQDIWEHINNAVLLVADVTDRNPNVFYEVGLAHALPKRLIILTQKKEDVPFDLQHIRWIKYKNSVSGRKELAGKLYKTIKNIMS